MSTIISNAGRILLSVAWLWLATACISERSLGPQITEQRDVGRFEGVKVQHGIDVYIAPGISEKIEVKTAKRLVEDLRTEVKNGVLSIYFSDSWSIGRYGSVYIHAEHLRLIEASSGSDVRSDAIIGAPDLVIRCSSGSDIKADVETDYLEISCSSGSDVVVAGKADRLQATTSSGSDLNAMNLVVGEARLKTSSGSDIRLQVVDALYAKASGGSDILYRGNPSVVEIDTSSGSEVRKAGD
jgi:hypothetical protein